MSWTSPYFTSDEMRCSHTGKEQMNPEFMDMLTELRRYYGPLIITSAYRDVTHPIEAKKSKPGAHTYGRAVDIAVRGSDAFKLLQAIYDMECFYRIGVQQAGSGRFIHIDNMMDREGFPSPWLYSY